ncbi:beta-galactosidase, partial [uncultured Muribaculum sp.]
MNRFAIILSVFLISLCRVNAADVKLHNKGTATQLTVNGNPFIVLGGELGNSSASSPADIERIFPKLRRMNLNTVLVPVYWDLIEPEEGRFDYSLIDKTIDEARKNDLKVIFLWFGAWKNSMSCYAPTWFKADYKKYPRACTSLGKPLEIASAFSENVFKADSKAFESWLKHVNDYDNDGTVLMIQIENEIGMLEDARDYSKAAQKEYEKGVPDQLMSHLRKNRSTLHPSLLERWKQNGEKASGSWREVFGDDIY